MSVVADGKQNHVCPFEEYVSCLICEITVGISRGINTADGHYCVI